METTSQSGSSNL